MVSPPPVRAVRRTSRFWPRRPEVEVGDVVRALHYLDRSTAEIHAGQIGVMLNGFRRTRQADAPIEDLTIGQRTRPRMQDNAATRTNAA